MDDIRDKYTKDWASKDLFKQQMGIALYFIDKLALRAGHEKDEDEADTVGCCTLKARPCFLRVGLRYSCCCINKSLLHCKAELLCIMKLSTSSDLPLSRKQQ